MSFEKDLSVNLAQIKSRLQKSSDLIFYEFANVSYHKAFLVYLNGFVETEILNRDILTPLMNHDTNNGIEKLLYNTELKKVVLFHSAVMGILEGNVLLVIDGQQTAFLLGMDKQVQRTIEEPGSESVVRGPKEGFIESIKTNIILLRKKLKTPDLMVESFKMGRLTQTEIAIVYLAGIVDPDVLKELKSRLDRIDTDSILESGYLEQYIEDAKYSPYPTIGNTQKPDVVAGKLLEGRIAIFCDGSPHVLTVPFLYIENLQTSEDYYIRTLMASLLRFLRTVALIISTLLPGVYVALSTYHQEMIPTVMLITIAGSREGIPLPAFVEALIMGVMFELLKESGTRLPRAIGSAISIVGGLVIGQAAVNAGLVSAPLVIVTAITAVASFILPALTETMTLFRLVFLFLAGAMGLVGITCGIFFIFIYTVSLRSFGVPFTASLTSTSKHNMKDTFFRFPLQSMKQRPNFMVGKNKKRRGGGA